MLYYNEAKRVLSRSLVTIFVRMKPYTGTLKLLFTAIVALVASSCGEQVDHGGKTPLLGVGNEYLYKEDVEQLLTSNRMIKDSAEFVQEYMSHWLEDVLLYRQAKRNVAQTKEIDRLIQNYKKSLLLNLYQERLVDQQLDKEITLEEITSFYENNKAMFRMEEAVVKGIFLKLSLKAPKLESVRRWCKSDDPAELEKLEKYTLTNAQIYEYFCDDWQPLSMLASKITLSEDELNSKVASKGMVEFKDTSAIYMMNITDYLPVGTQKPLDLAEAEIKELLVNSRKAEFLQRVKKDIYTDAINSGEVIFYGQEEIPGRTVAE
jgi:hypothetical protein